MTREKTYRSRVRSDGRTDDRSRAGGRAPDQSPGTRRMVQGERPGPEFFDGRGTSEIRKLSVRPSSEGRFSSASGSVGSKRRAEKTREMCAAVRGDLSRSARAGPSFYSFGARRSMNS